jgi:Superfamily II DNA and RNA helicases
MDLESKNSEMDKGCGITENGEGGKNYNDIVVESFEELDLKEPLLRGIYAYGYEKPSAIQRKAILPLIDGHDVIAQAQSGTGKTATFSIGLLQKIDNSQDRIQGLILAHTRELALQIHKVITNISTYLKISLNLSVGGSSSRDNIDKLQENPHIVIGTPGRVLDMINKKALNTKYIRMLIIDEADEMLSKIFSNQIYDIFRFLPIIYRWVCLVLL